MKKSKNNNRRSPWIAAAFGCLSLLLGARGAMAQESLPVCSSPDSDEFLVLVFTPSQPLREEVRQQVRNTLSPNENDLLVCQYGGNVLSRIGGFPSQAKATEWAEYFDDAVGLPVMVIKPVTETASAAIAPPEIPSLAEAEELPEVIVPTEAVVEPEAFEERINPEREIPVAALDANLIETEEVVEPFQTKALTGEGFGVLVDYGDNPVIAAEVQALVENDVALVSHSTRGYLMAAQVEDEARLIELLNLLSQNDFVAIAVPLQQIIMLKADIAL